MMARIVLRLAFLLAVSVGLVQPSVSARAQPAEVFDSPEQGFAALAEAATTQSTGAVLRVLGADGRRLVMSGDPEADRAALERFALAYQVRHQIIRQGSDFATLQVGDDDWPLPIPMVQSAGGWRFDAASGEQELVTRRIGRNELDAIETLRAIVQAQGEYARSAGRQGPFSTYATRFESTPGLRDGLYWPTGPGEQQSPLGEYLAAAGAAGDAVRQPGQGPRPFNGYLFRILIAQGPNAPGGSLNYVLNGRLIGGFAVLAWPARYGDSGIKTFIVRHDGIIYERDLGRNSDRIARGMTAFDPGPEWAQVAD